MNMLKNALALLAGFIVGGIVNMGLIMIGSVVVPLPAGVDATDMESLKAGMHLFELQNFIFPWLAHALGTLVGAAVTAWLAVSHKFRLAMVIAAFFLLGGITNVMMLPSPLWFTVADLLFAYLPMGVLGYKLHNRFAQPVPTTDFREQ